MDIETLIRSRRSVGSFTDQPVPLDLVQELLETAVYAPNHRMTEPWRFVIMTDSGVRGYAAIRREMALDGMKNDDPAARERAGDGVYQKFATIPMFVAVIMTRNSNPEIHDEDYAACAALIQNFMLLAWGRGLGSCWKTFKNDPRLRDYLRLTPDDQVIGVVHAGYPAESPASGKRQSARERTLILGD